MYQRGDIVLVPFPFTDLSSSKRRPAIVISNDEVNATGDVIIVMITSQDKSDSLQIEISSINVSPALPKRSFVRCHRITVIESSLITEVISRADKYLVKQIEQKIIHLITESVDKLEDLIVG